MMWEGCVDVSRMVTWEKKKIGSCEVIRAGRKYSRDAATATVGAPHVMNRHL